MQMPQGSPLNTWQNMDLNSIFNKGAGSPPPQAPVFPLHLSASHYCIKSCPFTWRSDLWNSRAISLSLGHTFVAWRCWFKFHVCNSKWQGEEKLETWPPEVVSSSEEEGCYLQRGCRCLTNCRWQESCCVRAFLEGSHDMLTQPIHISWWHTIYCWPNLTVCDGYIFILIRNVY